MMRLGIAIIVMFLSVLALIGQSTVDSAHPKKVKKATIENLDSKAEVTRRKLTYRQKITKLSCLDDRQPPNYTSTTLVEILPPDRERIVEEERDEKGIHRSESIYIARKQYEKEEDGPWKVDDIHYWDPILDDSGFWNGPLKCEYLYLGEQNLNGVVVDLYQVTTTSVGDKFKRTVDKSWFDKRGRLLKEQIDTTNSVTRSLDQKNFEYEYDIPIKIEAPIK